MAMSCSYADILKQQFSLAPNAMPTTANNCPPCKGQATLIDYDSNQLVENSSTMTAVAPNTSGSLQTSLATTQLNKLTQTTASAELLTIKNEIIQLKTMIAMAVTQITQALVSFNNNNCTPPLDDAMDMDTANQSHGSRNIYTKVFLTKYL